MRHPETTHQGGDAGITVCILMSMEDELDFYDRFSQSEHGENKDLLRKNRECFCGLKQGHCSKNVFAENRTTSRDINAQPSKMYRT